MCKSVKGDNRISDFGFRISELNMQHSPPVTHHSSLITYHSEEFNSELKKNLIPNSEFRIPNSKSHLAIYICIFAYMFICLSLVQAETQLITTHISLGKNVEDYILITETGGVKVTVTIDFYNQKGDLVESIRKILPSHATIKMQVSKFLHETGIIMVNSDSDGIAGQHYYAVQSNRKRKNRVLISVPLQIREAVPRSEIPQSGKGESQRAESISREIGTGQVGARQFCIPYTDFISDPDDVGTGADVPSSSGAGVGSYIVVSDASEDLRTSGPALEPFTSFKGKLREGSMFEMCFYNREGEAINKVKNEIGKRETRIFKLNEYINGHGGITLHDYQEREAKSPLPPFFKGGLGGIKFGKVNLNITAGDVICEYVQFHPSNGVLIIPGIIYDSENKLPTPAPEEEGTEVPIVLYRFPLFSLQTPNGKMAPHPLSPSPKAFGEGQGEASPGPLAPLPFFEKLFITDIFGYGPAVNVEVLNNSSELLTQTRKLIPPHGTSMLELEDYTTNFVFGAIKIHSQSQIAAVYYFSPATPQFPTYTFYSYAVSSAGDSEIRSKKLPTSFVIPWLSPCDDMELHLLITRFLAKSATNEVNEIQINFYHKDGSSFEEGQEGKRASPDSRAPATREGQGGRSVPKVLLKDTSALLKPGIIHEWQPGILFPKDEQGSILLNSNSSNLAVLLLGVNANTGQIVMSVQVQVVP
jgi:hypothetical protein